MSSDSQAVQRVKAFADEMHAAHDSDLTFEIWGGETRGNNVLSLADLDMLIALAMAKTNSPVGEVWERMSRLADRWDAVNARQRQIIEHLLAENKTLKEKK